MPDYTVVWRDDCKWCDRAKELLEDHGLSYKAVKFDAGMKPLFEGLGLTTLPQIWIRTHHIGGFQNLKTFLENEG